MNANQLYKLHGDMSTEGITFAYCGYVTESILTGMGDALKQKLESEDTDTRTIRSVFAVFVEQMQNIIRYSAGKIPISKNAIQATDADTPRYGILTIGQNGADYVVHSGNLVISKDVPRMQTRLSQLQSKTHEELKREYKEQLKSNSEEFNLGAGIGFIEIARRASKPIEFDFHADRRHTHFFFVQGYCLSPIWDTIEFPATSRTPAVWFNFNEHHLKLTGESYPEDVTSFYNPLFESLDNYLNELNGGNCRFDFQLVYFNSSSAKAIMMLMEKLEEAAAAGNRIDVHWFYDPEDGTMEELGEEFGEDLEAAHFHLKKNDLTIHAQQQSLHQGRKGHSRSQCMARKFYTERFAG